MGMLKYPVFVFQKDTNPHNHLFGFLVCKTLQEIMWNSGSFDYSELQKHLENLKAINFGERTEKCKISSNLMDKAVANMDDHAGPIFQKLLS